MALNKSQLGAELLAASRTVMLDQESNPDGNAAETLWNAIAGAIIDHFTNNGDINTIVNTTGTATNQTGTGRGGIS